MKYFSIVFCVHALSIIVHLSAITSLLLNAQQIDQFHDALMNLNNVVPLLFVSWHTHAGLFSR